MTDTVRIHDKVFELFLSAEQIRERVQEIGSALSVEFEGQHPVFLVLLNGSFIFAADLFRAITIPAEIAFARLSSYEGMTPGTEVQTHWQLDAAWQGRQIIIVEDIIDTGATLAAFLPRLAALQPLGITIVTLLSKPEALQYPAITAAHTGFRIASHFVVGYGMDYDGYGRNLPALYRLQKN